MQQYQYEANEQFFDNIFNMLKEGGKYGWPDAQKIFTKEDGKLVAQDQDTYNLVGEIVRPEYLKRRFIVKPK